MAEVPRAGVPTVDGPGEIVHGRVGTVVPVEGRCAHPQGAAAALPARPPCTGVGLAPVVGRPVRVKAVVDVGRRGAARPRAVALLVGPRPSEEVPAPYLTVVPVDPGAHPVREAPTGTAVGPVRVLGVAAAADGPKVPGAAADAGAREEARVGAMAVRAPPVLAAPLDRGGGATGANGVLDAANVLPRPLVPRRVAVGAGVVIPDAGPGVEAPVLAVRGLLLRLRAPGVHEGVVRRAGLEAAP